MAKSDAPPPPINAGKRQSGKLKASIQETVKHVSTAAPTMTSKDAAEIIRQARQKPKQV